MGDNRNTWTCGECLNTTEYTPTFDGDFPEGWFGLENNAWATPLCSVKCVRAYAARYEPDAADGGSIPPQGKD